MLGAESLLADESWIKRGGGVLVVDTEGLNV